MKGQYLAVETVLTFGLGLMVAIGVITLFNQYKVGVLDDAEPDQVELIVSQVSSAMNALKEIDEENYGSGTYEVDLPKTVSGRSYSLRIDGGQMIMKVGQQRYAENLTGFSNYKLNGGVSGGDVTVFKEEDQFILRAE